jgi:hypothetical protein
MTKREVRGFLLESCGVKGPEFISSVTGAVMAEVGAWLAQPLEPMYGGILRRIAGSRSARRADAQRSAFKW